VCVRVSYQIGRVFWGVLDAAADSPHVKARAISWLHGTTFLSGNFHCQISLWCGVELWSYFFVLLRGGLNFCRTPKTHNLLRNLNEKRGAYKGDTSRHGVPVVLSHFVRAVEREEVVNVPKVGLVIYLCNVMHEDLATATNKCKRCKHMCISISAR
jgi:hypothetical protein